MGTWVVDGTKYPGVLYVKLIGKFTVDDMRAFQIANNAAIDKFGRTNYRVFADMRELQMLSPECAEIQQEVKRHSSQRANFRGSAVVVSTSLMSLQHRRTADAAGVASHELITDSEVDAWTHLRKVERKV